MLLYRASHEFGIAGIFLGVFVFTLSLSNWAAEKSASKAKPKDVFVDLHAVDPTILVEMRYFGNHNFIGKPIKGYKAPKCLLTKQAAQALSKTQKDLKRLSFSLKVYDCYRPQKAVDHFAKWAKDLKDTKMKKEFYPMVAKEKLFEEGYIAHKSGHSRGSTVDLTIVPLPASPQALYHDGDPLVACYAPPGTRFKDNSLDMGTGYDCFSPLANTANPKVGRKQLKNRFLLKKAMEKQDFVNYDKEWWHYTLKNESYPEERFNFDVR